MRTVQSFFFFFFPSVFAFLSAIQIPQIVCFSGKREFTQIGLSHMVMSSYFVARVQRSLQRVPCSVCWASASLYGGRAEWEDPWRPQRPLLGFLLQWNWQPQVKAWVLHKSTLDPCLEPTV